MGKSSETGKKLYLTHYQRHIFLCLGPRCSDLEKGRELWAFLKGRLDQLGVVNTENAAVYRSKVDCLRVCKDGPIAVVYPEGTWYHKLNKDKMEEIILSHLIGGNPVTEYQLAKNDLIFDSRNRAVDCHALQEKAAL